MVNFVGNSQEAMIEGSQKIRLGFVPLIDCAPLVIAQEAGLFSKYGLEVELQKEIGWESLCHKLIYGELHGAHAIVGAAFSGLTSEGKTLGGQQASVCAMLLGTHGNAITISRDLYEKGFRCAADLAGSLASIGRMTGNERPPLFAVPHDLSSHRFLLADWLRRSGLKLGEDIQFVSLPPNVMCDALERGDIDGYCVGEPYNSMAVEREIGCVLAVSAEISPLHPEKGLLLNGEFAAQQEEEVSLLVAALQEACLLCGDVDQQKELSAMLAKPNYLSLSKKSIYKAMQVSPGEEKKKEDYQHRFFGQSINAPSMDKASWLVNQMRLCGLVDEAQEEIATNLKSIFREDLYLKGLARLDKDVQEEILSAT